MFVFYQKFAVNLDQWISLFFYQKSQKGENYKEIVRFGNVSEQNKNRKIFKAKQKFQVTN